ncbi:hypothetical protein LSAT2_004129 [Lamellibrachia satsuma]|nr:hypothetical protein LSAT2_004129 [Lamellibrachia satsuma]
MSFEYKLCASINNVTSHRTHACAMEKKDTCPLSKTLHIDVVCTTLFDTCTTCAKRTYDIRDDLLVEHQHFYTAEQPTVLANQRLLTGKQESSDERQTVSSRIDQYRRGNR